MDRIQKMIRFGRHEPEERIMLLDEQIEKVKFKIQVEEIPIRDRGIIRSI